MLISDDKFFCLLFEPLSSELYLAPVNDSMSEDGGHIAVVGHSPGVCIFSFVSDPSDVEQVASVKRRLDYFDHSFLETE